MTPNRDRLGATAEDPVRLAFATSASLPRITPRGPDKRQHNLATFRQAPTKPIVINGPLLRRRLTEEAVPFPKH